MLKVLLVDDSKTILHIMSKMLNELGYSEVHTAENPKVAEEKIKCAPPDLIISDWNMPGGTGFDLLKFVRSNGETAKIPFIMLTSDHDKSKIVKAKGYNPQSYILKPATKQQLAERLTGIAETHGIQPPKELIKQTRVMTSEPLKQKSVSDEPQETGHTDLEVDKELLTKTIKKLLLVYNEKADPAELLTWLAKKHYSTVPENLSGEDIEILTKVLSGIIEDTLSSIYDENSQ